MDGSTEDTPKGVDSGRRSAYGPDALRPAAAYEALHNRLFTDPLLGRGYPTELGFDDAVVRDGDLDVIAAPIDVLRVNYYNPTGVRAPEEGSPLPFEPVPLDGYPRTAFDWPVAPDGLRELLGWLHRRHRRGDPARQRAGAEDPLRALTVG